MAGIDIDIIQSNVLNKRTAMQKISSLLLNKVAENERLIKSPLEILLGELPTDGTCPEPTRLQNILDKRNNIVGFLNRFSNFLDVTTSTYIGTNVAFNALLATIRGINISRVATSTASKAIPFGLPGAIPALLSDLGDLSDKLTFDSLGESKLVKTKSNLDNLAIILSIVSNSIKTIIGILNQLDALLTPCLGDNQTLDPVNEGLIALANREEESQDLTYNGFTFQIEEVPFSPTVTRKRALAFNTSGIALLQTPLSFTANDQTLIDELKLIIDRDNLKAY
jgi:hypothetical protein